jgi:hypothetical protein
MTENKFIPHTKIKVLETHLDNPNGLDVNQLIPLLNNKKYTTVAKDCLVYFKQGLLSRDKLTGRYIYKISEHGKNRFSYLEKNKITS